MFQSFESLIDPFRRRGAQRPPQRIWPFYAHYLGQAGRLFTAALVTGLMVSLLEVFLFVAIGRIVDLAQAGDPATFLALHAVGLIGAAAIVVLVRPLVCAVHYLLINQAITGPFSNLIRWQQYCQLLRQSVGFFQRDFAGRMATRIVQTAPSLRESAVLGINTLWYVTVYAGSSLWLFSRQNSLLTLPLIAWSVIFGVVLRWYIPRIRELAAKSSAARSALAGRVVDSYSNIVTIKLCAQTQDEERYAGEAMAAHLLATHAQMRCITLMEVTVIALNSALIVGTTGLALWLWHENALSIGDIVLSTGLVIRINNMTSWIMAVANTLTEQMGTVQDGMVMLSAPVRVCDHSAAVPLTVSHGCISFRNVRFGYETSQPVLQGLSLEIAPGEKIGLVGPSGAGKSTLLNLLLRFYDPDAGMILIDGMDISRVTQDSLRAQIAYITQDTSLFNRSIRENLRCARPSATDEQIHEALAQASALEFVTRMTDSEGRRGLECYVGERGAQLSGGQRQRISIARAILRDCPIMVLDEPTAALDSLAETMISEALDRSAARKTLIVIAHRLSTVARLDRIVMLEDGRITETGTHSELLGNGRLYARFWAQQSESQELRFRARA